MDKEWRRNRILLLRGMSKTAHLSKHLPETATLPTATPNKNPSNSYVEILEKHRNQKTLKYSCTHNAVNFNYHKANYFKYYNQVVISRE